MPVLTKPESGSHPPWARPAPPEGERTRALWTRPLPLPGEPLHPAWTRPEDRPEWMRVASRPPQLIVAVALLVAVVITVTLVVLGTRTAFQASVLSVTPVTGNQVDVTLQVRNERSIAATPTCQVQVFSTAYVAGDSGVGTMATFTLGRLAPGAVGTYDRTLTVPSGQAGAVTVAASSVSCR